MRRKPYKMISFVVSDEQTAAIKERMASVHMTNMSAYIRKMAIDGYIVNIDLSDVNEMIRLLRISGNNLNQIAKVANESNSIYQSDIAELQRKHELLWDAVQKLLNGLTELKR